jgi:dynein heavy chain
VLTLSGSSHLAPFLQLKQLIQREAVAAEDNVRFLGCLEGPCQQLARATPAQLPALLPQILDCIRVVWSLSTFYNTPERIVGLLRKVSNEIISRCSAALGAAEVFAGNVAGAMDMLQQAMAAGEVKGGLWL